MSALDDSRQRDKALDISLSCCVQAPAGSGKTELLTQRMLKLLGLCQRPEEILAITFTRKAAAEMRNRVLDILAEASVVDDGQLASLPKHRRQTLELARVVLDRDAKLGWSLQANTSRLRINTIDSFNQFLVAKLPVTSALGMMPGIAENPRELFREAVTDLLKSLDSTSHLGRELEVLLTHLNNQWSTLESLLCGLLGKRDQWLPHILGMRGNSKTSRAYMEHTLGNIVESALADLDKALCPYLSRLLPLYAFAADNLAASGNSALADCALADRLPPQRVAAFGQWRTCMALLLREDNGKPALRKTVTADQGFPAQSAPGSKTDKALRKQYKSDMVELLQALAGDEALRPSLETFFFLPEPSFNDRQWRVLESLIIILPQLVSHLSLVFAHHQQTDYPHISAAALEALGDDDAPTDLALRMDYHLKHILVDEFQDTSSLQLELLEKLVRGWKPGDGRTLFIVGDGMQSCYGFRNARVGLFLKARDNGIGSVQFEDLRLSSNFRSEAPVIDWVNAVFRDAFPAQDDIGRGGVSFNPAAVVHPGTSDGGVQTYLVQSDKDIDQGNHRARYREALLVADKVMALQADFPDEDIAILVRSRNQLQHIIPVLRERRLTWNASDIDPLPSYPAIRDLLSLVRAMLNPGDTLAWLALLRSPLAGLRLDDIYTLVTNARSESRSLWQTLQRVHEISGLSEEGHIILARILPPLALARRERQRLPLRDWVENLWVLLGGPACLEDQALAANIEQCFRLLEEHDTGGDIPDIHLFEADITHRYGGGQHPEAKLHIMTIHKAKGLEFHHVIVPGLDKTTGSNDNPLLLWKQQINANDRDGLVVSLPSQKGRDRDNDAVYRYLKYELEVEQRLETTRLMYIAVTRAMRQAILVGCVTNELGEIKPPSEKSLLGTIWKPLQGRIGMPDLHYIDVTASSPLPPQQRESVLDQHIFSRRLKPGHVGLGVIEPATTVDTLIGKADSHHNLLEKQIGEIIHYCLHRISTEEIDPDDPKALARLEPRWRQQLGRVTDAIDDAVTAIHRQLAACQRHDRFAWLVRHQHEDAGSELALSDSTGTLGHDYVIDRTFVDQDGTRWVIDYKSSAPTGQDTLDGFLEQQSTRYRAQLARYASLFKAMENRPVRMALFFTAIPCFHEVTPAPVTP